MMMAKNDSLVFFMEERKENVIDFTDKKCKRVGKVRERERKKKEREKKEVVE